MKRHPLTNELLNLLQNTVHSQDELAQAQQTTLEQWLRQDQGTLTCWENLKHHVLAELNRQKDLDDMTFLIEQITGQNRQAARNRFPAMEIRWRHLQGKRCLVIWPEGLSDMPDDEPTGEAL